MRLADTDTQLKAKDTIEKALNPSADDAAYSVALNLVSNLIFTPIQFGWRNLPLASADILIVWGTILWMIAVLWRRHPWVAAAQIPYLAWVSTATVLQLSITWMNR